MTSNLAPRYPYTSGDINTATYMLIGEAPGKQENFAHTANEQSPNSTRPEAFVGKTGKILRNIIDNSRIRQTECYFTNVVKEHPPHDDIDKIPVAKINEVYLPTLKAEIQRFLSRNGKGIILVGGVALKYIAGLDAIKKYRGSFVDPNPYFEIPSDIIVTATYHPSFVARGKMPLRTLMRDDIDKLARAVLDGYVPDENLRYILEPSVKEFIEYKNDVLLKNNGQLSLDIETVANQFTTIGLGVTRNEAISVLLFRPNGESVFSPKDEAIIWKEISSLLLHPNTGLIAQNAVFDMFYMFWYGFRFNRLEMDTMLAHSLLYSEVPKDLGTLSSLYADMPFHKKMPKFIMSNLEDYLIYNCNDVISTFRVYEAVKAELKKADLWDFHNLYYNELFKIMLEMGLRGITIDLKWLTLYRSRLLKRIEAHEEKLNPVVGPLLHPDKKPEEQIFNVNSPKQMMNILYGVLGIPPVIHRKTRQPTADKQALEKIFMKYESPFLDFLQMLREFWHDYNNYATAVVNSDGRMRTIYSVGVTENGRHATKKLPMTTKIDGKNRSIGVALQTVPKFFRRAFIPSRLDYELCEADLKQAEALVVYALSDDDHLLNAFAEGRDLHCVTAGLLFNIREEDVTKEQRQLAKKVTHATNYGIGPRKLAELLKIPQAEATKLIETLHRKMPKERRWRASIEDQLRNTRVLSNVFGRRRTFLGRLDQDTMREAYACIPQSTVSDITKTAMIRIYKEHSWITLLADMHDGILMEYPKTHREEMIKVVKECMEIPMQIGRHSLTIPVEISVGDNWRDLKPIA